MGSFNKRGDLKMELQTELNIDSREVAKMMEKRHADLLRDIAVNSEYLSSVIQRKIALNEFWRKSTYKDSIGRSMKCYLITKKGCEFLAHKMTGKKGAIFTAVYINRFHEMEEKLKNENGKEEPKRLIWKGQIVIRPIDLAAMIQVDVSRVRYVVKQFGLEQFFLIGNEMRLFRTQNNLPPSPSPRVLVYPEKTVRTLVQILKRASVALAQINKYFSPVHIPSAVKKDIRESIISINSPRVLKKLDTIRKNTILLEGMLNHFTTYKRTRAKHVSATELMTEVSANIMHDLHQLNQDISVSTLPEA